MPRAVGFLLFGKLKTTGRAGSLLYKQGKSAGIGSQPWAVPPQLKLVLNRFSLVSGKAVSDSHCIPGASSRDISRHGTEHPKVEPLGAQIGIHVHGQIQKLSASVRGRPG